MIHTVFYRLVMKRTNRKIVVLDDDPTGSQTIHDIRVYTDWEKETLKKAFLSEERMFFILTNSRSFSAEKTKAVHTDIAERLAQVSGETQTPFLLISRSDSTLRGHFPLETETLKNVLEEKTGTVYDGEIFLPFFPEGGRFTIDNVHYVRQGNTLVPASETEFARDTTFGYRSSDLREFCEEKTGGRYPAEDIVCISLSDIREEPDRIRQKLMQTGSFNKVIVNPETYEDLEVFTDILLEVIEQGKEFMIRGSAAIVRVLTGEKDFPLLEKKDLIKDNGHGGLIVVGSHIRKSTAQLEHFFSHHEVPAYCFRVASVFCREETEEEICRILTAVERDILSGKDIVIYTERNVIGTESEDREEALRISTLISGAVTDIVRRLSTEPSFIIAKGGITSSDIGVKALSVREAVVKGQVLAGIPVWDPGSGSKFPNVPYIIFPGNVGTEECLSKIYEKITS